MMKKPETRQGQQPLEEAQVTVEFFGIPRLRANCAETRLGAGSLFDLLKNVEARFPGLAGLVRGDGMLAPNYLLSINGERFAWDAGRSLRPGDRLLLFSADAGG